MRPKLILVGLLAVTATAVAAPSDASANCAPYFLPQGVIGTCPASGNWGGLADGQAAYLNLCDNVALNHKMQNMNGQPGYSKQVTNFLCSSGNPQSSITSSSALVTLSVPWTPKIYYRCRNVSGGNMGAQCWRSL